jgi:hypothetical protein
VIGSCNSGFGDCNGSDGDGCETNLQDDADNCGVCGTRCRGRNDTCCAGSCEESC